MDKPTLGSILFDNQEIASYNEKKLASFRNKNIGFVFQFHHLLPEFSAIENLCIPAYIAGIQPKAAHKRAMELLDFLHLENRADHKPSALSGGEQQRVAVARALMNYPSVILADEPSGNLDTVNARELHELFFTLRKQFNQTFVIVTHNQELADMSDRKLMMVDGKIIWCHFLVFTNFPKNSKVDLNSGLHPINQGNSRYFPTQIVNETKFLDEELQHQE